MSKNHSQNEITYSFIASYMWGVRGVSQTMTQYDRGVGGGPEEAKIVWHNKWTAPYTTLSVLCHGYLCHTNSRCVIPRVLPQYNTLREAFGLKNVTKSGKSPHSSWPPSPRKFWTFLNLGKIWNSMTPPLYLIWERFEIGKTLNLRNPPSNMEHKLKTLKIA